MEEWMALADTAPGKLLLAQGTASEVCDFANGAWDIVYKRCYRLMLVEGGFQSMKLLLSEEEVADEMLQSALSDLERHNELHDTAFRLFSLYGSEHLRLFIAAPLWEGDPARLQGHMKWKSWSLHRAETLACTAEVEQRLRSAQAHAFASQDAVTLAQGLPVRSQAWTAWVQMARTLARCAEKDVSNEDNLIRYHQMRDAVGKEYNDTYEILHP